jgi:diguanylate cyclase (GGDEF)-like protein
MRILVADDNLAFREQLAEALGRWGYEVLVADDGLTAWRILQEADAPTLALLDWMMPGMDGAHICEEVRRRPGGRYRYLILLTARADKSDVIGGLEAGADDYLVKPLDAPELKARLRAGRRILELQEQLLAAQESLRHQATHDPLTGLLNRAAILEALDRELARAGREGKPVGVLLADVDHFKAINDTYGHPAGDAVLREVGRRLGASLRPYDALGRYGGEEFLTVLPECDAEGLGRLGERLRQCVGEAAFSLPGEFVPVTLSLGGAAGTHDADALLRAADGALYRAKRAGRNRVELGGAPAANRPGPAPLQAG